jgi:hypothetical protein
VVLVLLAVASPAAGDVAFSDQAVGNAIEKGAKFLWSRQNPDGSWRDASGGLQIEGNDRQVGATALAAYALLAKGVKVTDPPMAKTLKWLEQQKTSWTYAVSLRAQAWMEAARQDQRYQRLLTNDARVLIRSGASGPKPPGSYGYRLNHRLGDKNRHEPLSDHDPSNGQYGVLGVWAAYQLNAEVPRQYWQYVLKYWAERQERDGGWKYTGGDKHSSGTMTSAGLATLFVCVDAVMADRFVRCQRTNEIVLLRKALEWFDRNFAASLSNDGLCHGGHGDRYYYLFGIERVGLASGYKYFGKANWYKLGATWLLNQQQGDGSWQGNWGQDVATAYALLFLVRGQHALLFNRLEYDGDWNNRPRALANFCRWARGAFEQDVYWQIVNLEVDVSEWHDAPILVITGSQAPKLTDDHLRRLREFLWQGGTIFSLTECSGAGFRDGIREVYKRLLPNRELKEVPPGQTLMGLFGRLPPRLKLFTISNDVRPFVVHSDVDLVVDWQLNRWLSQRDSFNAAANVAMYVTGKQLRHRGVHTWPQKPQPAKGPTVKLVRLRYDGNYDPEPLAWERVSRLIATDCKINLQVDGPVAIADLKPSGAEIATLTGTSALRLNEAEKAALKAFAQGGGLLLVDAAGGIAGAGKSFVASAEETIEELFGSRSLRTLSTEAELYRLKGYRIDRAHYHQKTQMRLGTTEPKLKAVILGDRIAVLFSREDLTIALIGCAPVDCDGYTPSSAYEIARNVILYAAKRGGR